MSDKMTMEQILPRIERRDEVTWRIPRFGPMRTDGVFFASEPLLRLLKQDQCLVQLANVATLPGIQGCSLAMPDIHWGYGFPIGGVAAFDVAEGVVSPGGVGYDINCGVRVLASRLTREEVQDRIPDLVAALFQNVPAGVGSRRKDLRLSVKDEEQVLARGAEWAIRHGFGDAGDLANIEDRGCVAGADPDAVSEKARERGRSQLGTLGSGNHFLEIGYIDELYDDEAAAVLGLSVGQVTVSVHTGSRGLGYQVCDDYLVEMREAAHRYGIELPDPQLCCAPVDSPEGRRYLGAMAAAANFAFTNRQLITHWVRESFQQVLGRSPRDLGLRLVYDVAHNIAKIESHTVEGKTRKLCVHRKGATRSFGPGRPELPERYRTLGQPVIIPGDMGRCSFILVGNPHAMEATFGSTCHGAGRVLSRHAAIKAARGRHIAGELKKQGITVMAASKATLVEEMPEAYKDVTEVVRTVHEAGLSRMVARLRPLGVVKG
jgi:tRNA-splicing ligase RtcB